MNHKREEARRARAEARAGAARKAADERERGAAAAEKAKELDVVPALRTLGFRANEARRAAAHCDSILPDGPLEERVRAALRFLNPPARRWCPPPSSPGTAP
jgi:Holliday junction resolvasome RuvABC DNA-binding subunit